MADSNRGGTPPRPDDAERVAAPGTHASKMEAADQYDEDNAVEADFSKSERILQQGLPKTYKARTGRLQEEELPKKGAPEAADEKPRERIANPFAELIDFDIYTNKAKVAQIERDENGAWRTREGASYADVAADNSEAMRLKERAGVPAHHPDMEQPVGAELVDKILGPGVADIRLKKDVSDYLSRRDEMRSWWREKMKSTSSKDRPGMMLGVDVPPRDAIRDHTMMMAQFGKGHLPRTTEEWEIHNTWAHKRKYMMKVPTVPRYVKWGKRIRNGVIGGIFFAQCAWVGFSGYKQDQSWRYTKTTDVTNLTDKHSRGYESRSKYPFTAAA